MTGASEFQATWMRSDRTLDRCAMVVEENEVLVSRTVAHRRHHLSTPQRVDQIVPVLPLRRTRPFAAHQGTHFQMSSVSPPLTSPCQDHFGMCNPSGTSSAEWWYRHIVVV